MMSQRLAIEKLSRTVTSGETESIQFEPGVNVIVGPQNAGKSTWLQMFDYLMGETESVIGKFDQILVDKYRSVASTMTLGDETVVLERQWIEGGRLSRMALNGQPFPGADIQKYFLEHLGIPILRYPQGNVFTSERTWPTLGWRSLLRHIYRRQGCWGDLVPQQPESEQHACILQFLGLAEHLFAHDLALLVDKQKQITRLQNRKDYFVELMNQIAPDLIGNQDISVGITAQSIETACTRVQQEINGLITSRIELLSRVRDQIAAPHSELTVLMEERTLALNRLNSLRATVAELDDRGRDLDLYRTNLQQEVERLDRAGTAADIFDDLRVTHCPACDQSVETRSRPHGHCFLCGQATSDSADSEAAGRRLKFEREQIAGELSEADELVRTFREERSIKCADLSDADRRLRELEATLRPFQASASVILPEEVALIDQRIGSLNAQMEALKRLLGPLQTRDSLTDEIETLQTEIHRLEASVATKEEKAELEIASDRFTDGFNTYLNRIRQLDQTSWTKAGSVAVRVTDRRTQYLIDGRPAKAQLGATLTIFFLFAYQFALLNLSRFENCHYPGVTILDFFPDIAKSAVTHERLGLVLDPFTHLAQEIAPVQVIATARDFPHHMPNVNLIHLTHTWR
jgi:hypothetical protein